MGPTGASDDIMGPDAHRTSLFFQHHMPELGNDPRFAQLCARLGLVEFWRSTGSWPDWVDEVPYDLRVRCEWVRQVLKDQFWP